MMARQRFALIALGALACNVAGCVGQLTMVAPQPPPNRALTDAGPAEGSACGLLLLNVLPLGVNDRAARAYAEAVNATNAAALTDTSIEDRWYFILVGTLLCSDIKGRAVRYAPTQE